MRILYFILGFMMVASVADAREFYNATTTVTTSYIHLETGRQVLGSFKLNIRVSDNPKACKLYYQNISIDCDISYDEDDYGNKKNFTLRMTKSALSSLYEVAVLNLEIVRNDQTVAILNRAEAIAQYYSTRDFYTEDKFMIKNGGEFHMYEDDSLDAVEFDFKEQSLFRL